MKMQLSFRKWAISNKLKKHVAFLEVPTSTEIDRETEGRTDSLLSTSHTTLPSEWLARFQPVTHEQTLDTSEVAQVSLPFATQTNITSDDLGRLSLSPTLD